MSEADEGLASLLTFGQTRIDCAGLGEQLVVGEVVDPVAKELDGRAIDDVTSDVGHTAKTGELHTVQNERASRITGSDDAGIGEA